MRTQVDNLWVISFSVALVSVILGFVNQPYESTLSRDMLKSPNSFYDN